jgi:hypothetical protein
MDQCRRTQKERRTLLERLAEKKKRRFVDPSAPKLPQDLNRRSTVNEGIGMYGLWMKAVPLWVPVSPSVTPENRQYDRHCPHGLSGCCNAHRFLRIQASQNVGSA